MLKVIITFYDLCQKSIADSPADAKLTYAHIKTALAPMLQKVVDTKYVDPKAPTAQINKEYAVIVDEMKSEFSKLTDGI
jgi:V-type H+-transporting ATPase subunit A